MSAIAPVADVPTDSTLLFTVRDRESGEQGEAILHRTEAGVVCWRNYCQHFTHIGLDKGSGAPIRDGEFVCANHGAMFEVDTGLCTFGPCEGAVLEAVDVVVADNEVLLDDPDYEFVALGPADDDDDLTSSSNVKF